jgi:hypothetical protein
VNTSRSNTSAGGAETAYRHEVIASFSSYREAEQAITYLTEARIPTGKLRIVGQGLQIVRGRGEGLVRRLVEAGFVGAAVGALIMLLAALLGLTDGLAEGVTVLALLLGTACGLLSGATAVVVIEAAKPRSEARLLAERYDLTADPKIADLAARRIESAPRRPFSDAARSVPTGRTRA